MAVKRTFYQDRCNPEKTWEVVQMSGGYYLRQYIKGLQFRKGVRTTKKFIASLGIFEYEKTEVTV